MAAGLKIDICLSGGGFRATFFHLGVVRFLRDYGLLPHVRTITGVSGGSILAAHVVQRWAAYTGDDAEFRSAVEALIKFGQRDIRGRIMRRWMLYRLMPFSGRLLPQSRLVKLLQAHYSRLYGDDTLDSLGATAMRGSVPSVHLLATSMTTGTLCAFSPSGLTMDYPEGARTFRADLLPISLAVAASSAFPPLFPPVRITYDDLGVSVGEFRGEVQFLTDGGLFDNLGVIKLWRLTQSEPPDVVVISDASAQFDWQLRDDFGNLFTRTVRATDILMKRVSDLQQESQRLRWDARTVRIAVVSSSEQVADTQYVHALPDLIQSRVRQIRTDLDRFSDSEIETLVQHGYSVAYAQCCANASPIVGVNAPPVPPTPWRLRESGPSVPPSRLERMLRSSRARRVRLWNSRDWICWLLVLMPTLSAVSVTYYLRRSFVVAHQRVASARDTTSNVRRPSSVTTSSSLL